MTKKGNLIKLIKALSKSEKRYIKIHLKKSKEYSNYLLLFNFIDSATNYTDQSIKLTFHNKTFIKQLHVTKNYLTKLILKHLKNFHQKSNHKFKLLNRILEIEILINKEQFDLAEFYVESIVKQCDIFYDYISLYQALELKRKIITEKYGIQEGKKELNIIIEKENQILGILFNINEYSNLNFNFFDFLKAGSQFSKKQYTELSKHPLIQNQELAQSIEAKINYFYLHFQISAYHDHDFKAATENIQNILQLIEKKKNFLQENTNIYINFANQLINLYLYTKNYLVIPALLEKIRNLPKTFQLKTNHPDTLKGLLQSYLYELELYKHTGQTKLALNLIEDLEIFIKKHNYPITKDHLTQYYFLFAYFNFYNFNYLKTLYYLRLLAKLPTIENSLNQEKILGDFLELQTYVQQNRRIDLRKSLIQKKANIRKYRRFNFEEKLLFNFFENIQNNKIPQEQLYNQFHDYLINEFPKEEHQNNLIQELNINKWLKKELTNQ